jgi:hypothetical protein
MTLSMLAIWAAAFAIGAIIGWLIAACWERRLKARGKFWSGLW